MDAVFCNHCKTWCPGTPCVEQKDIDSCLAALAQDNEETQEDNTTEETPKIWVGRPDWSDPRLWEDWDG